MVLRLLVRLHEYNQRRIFSRFVYRQLLLTTGTSRCTYFTVTLLLPYNYNTANEVIKPVICERLAKFKIFKYTCIAIKTKLLYSL